MWIEQTPNGKWKYKERYIDPLTGKRKYASVTLDKNTAQAKKQATALLAEKIERKHEVIEKKYRLGEVYEDYIDSKRDAVKEASLTRYTCMIGRVVDQIGPDAYMDQLTPRIIKDKIKELTESTKTFNDYLRFFRLFLRWSYREEYTKYNYAEHLTARAIQRAPADIHEKYLEAEELRRLLDAFDAHVYREITRFLALSGLRIGEFLALKNDDIDLKNKSISITKTYQTIINKVSDTPKTASSNRIVFIQPELERCIITLQKISLERKIRYGRLANDNFLVGAQNEVFSYSTYQKALRKTSQKALGRDVNPHILRHTHASLLFEQGIPLETIQRRLGHEDSKITKEIYLHITQKVKERDNDMLRKTFII